MMFPATGCMVRGPAPFAADRPVHDGEQPRVELPLHVEEVDQDLVDVLVGVVADLLEQAAEGVLDRARRRRMAVRLDRRQVEDVLPDVHLRDLDALREDLVELEERALERVNLPLDLGKRRERQAVSLEDREASGCSARPCADW